MAELRPLLAILGLVVVVAGIFFWIGRRRGWRVEWWERFFAPGRRGSGRPAAREPGAVRGAPERSGTDRSSPTGRPPSAAPAGGRSTGAKRSGDPSERQGLIDLDFLPLLDPKDAVRGNSLDREFDMGDLGAIETESGDALQPARTRPATATASGTAREARKPTEDRGRGPNRGDGARRRPAASGQAPRSDETETSPGAQDTGRELLIVLTVVTHDERNIAGPVIREALGAFDLEPDPQGMFNHYGNRRGTARVPVFSVSSILEPGVFDLEAMDRVSTPGLCLFMRRPGPLPATVAFDLMLDVGTRLARSLGAVLCDDQRCRLTVQATQALRERVVHFALRHERGVSDGG